MNEGLALFDDYPGPILGHHPDLLVGLARAATGVVRGAPVQVHCPTTYLLHAGPLDGIDVHTVAGRRPPVDVELAERNLAQACRDAQSAGISVVVNMFFDETYAAVPLHVDGVRFLHVVHRAGELPRTPSVLRRLAVLAERDVFVVHTERGRQRLEQLIPGAAAHCIPWPAASQKEVRTRFTSGTEPHGSNLHALMVGGARRDKGIATLLEAVEGGPPLRIVGELAASDIRSLEKGAPANVSWNRHWVDRQVIDEAIRIAAVVVFPYLPEFAEHAGASGALAQAQTFAKPLIVSDVLASDLVTGAGCLQVPPGDADELREAITNAMHEKARLHEEARSAYRAISGAHTYESHVARLLSLATPAG